jgi:stage V sporulation protein S
MVVIRVKKTSDTGKIAGLIAGKAREKEQLIRVQAVGSHASFVAIKAIALARDYLSEDRIFIMCSPSLIPIDRDVTDAHGIQLDCITRRGARG